MRNLFNYIVTNFGFSDCSEFVNSFIHLNLITVTLPIVTVSSIFEKYFGLEHLTMISFLLLIILELLTGILSSKMRGIKIQSKKFSRFGLKVIVWLSLIFIVNSFRLEYKTHTDIMGTLGFTIFNWLHTFLFIYINMEYLISVLENLGVITGNKKNTGTIVKLIKDKLFSSFKS